MQALAHMIWIAKTDSGWLYAIYRNTVSRELWEMNEPRGVIRTEARDQTERKRLPQDNMPSLVSSLSCVTLERRDT